MTHTGIPILLDISLEPSGRLRLDDSPLSVDLKRIERSSRASRLDQHVEAWAHQVGVFADQHLARFRLGTLTALAHPRAGSDSRVLFAAEFIAGLYAVDDHYCDGHRTGSAPGLVTQRLAAAAATFQRPSLPTGVAAAFSEIVGTDPVLRALDHCASTLDRIASPVQCGRIRRETIALFLGMMAENDWRIGPRTPTLPEYLAVRQINGVTPNIAVLDLVHGEDMPAELFDAPEVRTLINIASNVLMWVNDLLSVPRESIVLGSTVGCQNLPSVIAFENHQPVCQAYEQAMDLYHDQRRQYIRLDESLALAGPEALRSFVGHVRDFVNGVLWWSTISSRFTNGWTVTCDNPDHTCAISRA